MHDWFTDADADKVHGRGWVATPARRAPYTRPKAALQSKPFFVKFVPFSHDFVQDAKVRLHLKERYPLKLDIEQTTLHPFTAVRWSHITRYATLCGRSVSHRNYGALTIWISRKDYAEWLLRSDVNLEEFRRDNSYDGVIKEITERL